MGEWSIYGGGPLERFYCTWKLTRFFKAYWKKPRGLEKGLVIPTAGLTHPVPKLTPDRHTNKESLKFGGDLIKTLQKRQENIGPFMRASKAIIWTPIAFCLHRLQLQESSWNLWLANKIPVGAAKGTYSCVHQGSISGQCDTTLPDMWMLFCYGSTMHWPHL